MDKQAKKRLRELKRQRERAYEALSKHQDLIIGSVVYLKRRCGTEKKYGAYFLSQSEQGKTKMTYLPKKKVSQVKEKVARYQKVKQILKQISDCNIKLTKEGGKE